MVLSYLYSYLLFFFFKHKTAYELRISDWSADVCSSDLTFGAVTAALDNPLFARGLQALEHRLELAGYGLLVASSNYEPARELKQVRTMVERGIDAIMLQGDSHLPEIYAVLQRKGIAYMNTWVYDARSEEHTSELQSLMRTSYAVFCLKK